MECVVCSILHGMYSMTGTSESITLGFTTSAPGKHSEICHKTTLCACEQPLFLKNFPLKEPLYLGCLRVRAHAPSLYNKVVCVPDSAMANNVLRTQSPLAVKYRIQMSYYWEALWMVFADLHSFKLLQFWRHPNLGSCIFALLRGPKTAAQSSDAGVGEKGMGGFPSSKAKLTCSLEGRK